MCSTCLDMDIGFYGAGLRVMDGWMCADVEL